jgi:outer membrane beta-barrel protein
MSRIGCRARVFALIASFSLSAVAARAWADDPQPPGSEPTPPGSEPTPPSGEPTPPGGEPTPPGQEKAATEKGTGELGSISWRDIVVVPRRPILKYHRVEIIPTYNVTVNNTLYRHHGFGGILNFFLSETLNIALEATYYQEQQQQHFFQRGLADRVLPSVNRYWWSATFNFGYVPVYGKFALFNKYIFQWEMYIGAGLGVIQTEWIPRDPANQSQTNFNVLWHIDLGSRLFLTKWLAIQVYLKDYMMVDSLEPNGRTTVTVPMNDEKSFVNNVVFGVGVGMFLPTGFEYKYTR